MSSKTISHIMTRNLVSLPPHSLLSAASETMSSYRISCLLVMQDNELIGILTEQDIVHAICCDPQSKTEPISKFMSQPVLTESEDMDIYEAFDFFNLHQIRHLVVVDSESNVSGIVTLTDLASATDSSDFLEFKKVINIMTPNPLTISPDESMQTAVQAMDLHKISCIIIASKGKPLGIITERDIASLIHCENFDPSFAVTNYMTSPVHMIASSAIALEASSLMHQKKLRRLVVVDEDENITGLVTLYDVVKGLTGRYIEKLKHALAEKTAELDLAQSQLAKQALQNHVLNDAPVIHYACHMEAGILRPVFVTPNINRVFGYQADTYIDHASWWQNHLHPYDRERVLASRQQTVAGDRTSFRQEYRFKHADGHYLWTQDDMTLVRDENGNVTEIAGSWADCSDRHEQMDQLNQLRQAIEHAGEAIIITDATGMIEYANPAYSAISGYNQHDCLGRQLPLFSDEKLYLKQHLKLWDSVSKGQSWIGTLMDRRKNGKSYPVMASVAPIFNEHGETTHYVSIQQDMTEHDELEKKFYQAQKMEALGTLVGGLAHDFNNMLSSMLGNIYLTRQKMSEMPELANRLKQVEKTGYDAASMITKMLTFARKGKIEMAPLPLTTFIKESYKLSRISTPENINMALNISAKDLYINADATQLQQVLLNLLTNARHALEDSSSPKINISLEKIENSIDFHHDHPELHEKYYAHLSISDNGHGIPTEIHDHVFEPFFTTKAAGKGTGLGLAMAYGSIQAHGGLIEIDSDSERGCTFHIYLPLIEKSHHSESHSDLERHAQSNETILIVDDEASVLSITDEILSHLGYKVLHADNGQACINLFNQFPDEISLIITDVIMPEMNGVDAINTIRASSANVPVIFLTGYDKQHISGIEQVTHSQIIHKPASIPELSSTIHKLLETAKK